MGVLLFLGGYCSNNELVEYIQRGVIELCSTLKDEAVSLVDAISPPDFIINSPLGYADGNVSWFRMYSDFGIETSN